MTFTPDTYLEERAEVVASVTRDLIRNEEGTDYYAVEVHASPVYLSPFPYIYVFLTQARLDGRYLQISHADEAGEYGYFISDRPNFTFQEVKVNRVDSLQDLKSAIKEILFPEAGNMSTSDGLGA